LGRWLPFLALLATHTAHAEPPHVIDLTRDPNLAHAMTTALTSWHIGVSPSDDPPPGRDLDDAVRTAHRIARGGAARIVVWVSKDETSGAYSLWIYDDGTRGIVVRQLTTAPPYDDETAAAIALTVKTVLRDVLEKPAHAPTLTEDDEFAFRRAHKSPSLHSVRMLVFGGARVPTNASDVVAARVGAEVTYFYRRELGFAIGIDAGPSVLVEHLPYISGTATDTVFVPFAVKWRIPVRPWFSLELGVGAGAHFTTLEGSAPIAGLAGRVLRTDLSLETAVGVELAWKTFRIAPMFGSSLRAHYQRYEVNGVQAFDIPPGQMFYALRVGVELP
jgi:hypothetical protein